MPFAGGSAEPAEPALVLAESAAAHYRISIQEGAGDVVAFAAGELAHYLEQMSGARFHVATGGNAPGKSIVLRSEKSYGDAYTIAVEKKQILLTGAADGAVLFAVYDFLEQLGCRWLAPRFSFYAGAAEVVPKTGKLAFTPGPETRRSPRFALRKLDVSEGLSHDITNLIQLIEWLPKAGFNTLMLPLDFGNGRVQWDQWRAEATPELRKRGLSIEVGGHGYENFIYATMPAPGAATTKLFDQHPDWFGMNETGQRDRSKKRVFCTSNTQAAQYLVAQVVDYLKSRPEIDVFDFWPPDGALWCECAACRALGDPADRQALLVSRLHRSLKAAGLNKVRLEIIAYSRALLPPAQAALPPDVLVDFCPINQSFEAQINDSGNTRNSDYMKALRRWREVYSGDLALYSYYRKYAWKSLPAVLPHYLQKDLRFYATVPLQGVHAYAEPGDWATFELNFYALGRLAWDPNTSVDALVAEFCRGRYGAHAALVERVLRQMQELVRTTCSLPFTALKSPEQISAAQARLRTAQSEVRGAAESAEPAATAALRRLNLCLEYALRDLEIQHARASKVDKAQLQTRVKSLVEFLLEHKQEGVFVMTGRNDLDRFYKRYYLTD